MTRHPPVGDVLPDVAGHVEEAVAVGREGARRRGAVEAVLPAVAGGKGALPGVRLPALERVVGGAPGVCGAVESAAGAEEIRVGKGGVGQCELWWAAEHKKK